MEQFEGYPGRTIWEIYWWNNLGDILVEQFGEYPGGTI